MWKNQLNGTPHFLCNDQDNEAFLCQVKKKKFTLENSFWDSNVNSLIFYKFLPTLCYSEKRNVVLYKICSNVLNMCVSLPWVLVSIFN